jgi:hypothetical protein
VRCGQLRSQFGSSHARHDEIRDQDVDGACVRVGNGHGFHAVGRGQHVVPIALQGSAHQL